MNTATQKLSAAFGTLVGLVGIEHAVGEILQGPVRPAGVIIQSWPDTPFFSILGGEPAMTLLPNLLVSGILAALASLAFIAWALWGPRRRSRGPVFLLISLVMLLVGGGFGPPLLGTVLGLALTVIDRLPARPRASLSPVRRRRLAALASASLAACLLAWLLLFPGVSLLSAFFTLDAEIVVPALFFTALGALALALGSAAACDRALPAA